METINYNGNGSTFKYYSCISEMANIQVPDVNKENYINSCVNEHSRDIYEWTGCRGGFAEVKRLVELEGWKAGVDRGRELMDVIKVPKLPSVRRKKTWGAMGTHINLGRLYNGNAEKCWQTTRKVITKNKKAHRGNVNILIDLTANASMSADQFYWKGALGCVLAKAIQKSGRSVRVLGSFSVGGFTYDKSYQGGKNLTAVLNIKDFGTPVEYNSMFAMTALAGASRYYFFKSILSINAEITGGLGHCQALDPKYFEPIIAPNTPTIVIEDVWSKSTALRRAEKVIDEL